jgi:hypothetical protein
MSWMAISSIIGNVRAKRCYTIDYTRHQQQVLYANKQEEAFIWFPLPLRKATRIVPVIGAKLPQRASLLSSSSFPRLRCEQINDWISIIDFTSTASIKYAFVNTNKIESWKFLTQKVKLSHTFTNTAICYPWNACNKWVFPSSFYYIGHL